MKKIFKNLFAAMAVLILFCAVITGCGGKDDEEKSSANIFTYDGQAYEVTKGIQEYKGFSDIIGSDANYINLVISNNNLDITLVLYVPDSEDRLVAGTYEGKSSFKSFSCLGGNVKLDGETYTFTVATVTVAVKDDTYTIDVAGVIKDGGPFTGNYTGELEWVDASKKSNSFTYAGKTVKMVGGWQDYYGHYYSNDANSISLYVGDGEGTFLQFEMFVSNSNNKLVAGTYLPKTTFKALTCAGGFIYEDGDDTEPVYEISPSTVTVGISGSTFTINVDGTLADDRAIKGNYTGELDWYDESASIAGTGVEKARASQHIRHKIETLLLDK